MGCVPHRRSSTRPRWGVTSRARAGCKFVLSTLLAIAALIAVAFAPGAARAQDATWRPNAATGNFNTRTNWIPDSGVPTGTASFGTSNTTALTFSTNTSVGGWTFNAGASAYTFSNNQALTFIGAGISIIGGSAAITNTPTGFLNFTGNSTAANASITNEGILNFNLNSTAGNAIITNTFATDFNNNSSAGNATFTNNTGGTLEFNDTASAANALITNQSVLNFNLSSTAGSASIINGDTVSFNANSTAGSATIANGGDLNFNNGSTAGNASITNATFGSMVFNDSSTAGNATITNNNNVFFESASTAGNATITNNHNVFFSGTSTAGTAAITSTVGALVDFSGSTGPAGDNQLTAGSIGGAGSFQLGRNELAVGGNNMSTNVSGIISGIGNSSLVKVGTGTLTLSGTANLGGTTIDGGTLAVNGGTLNASSTIIVGSTAGSSGTLNIGAGGGVSTQDLIVGQGGVGMLAVQNGGTLTDFGGFVGNLPGAQGTVTVSAAGSTWTNTDTVQIGALGTGTLAIQDGGTVNTAGGGSIGLSATGTVTVTDPGSTWNLTPGGGLNIGSFGTGTLTIANGGMVINNTAVAADIGDGAGSQGTVTVTGAGSTWSNRLGVNIGNSGTGTLTIADGGTVSAGPVVIAANAGAIGTLNIGAGADNSPAAPGTLTAPSVAFGAGTGTINFNHTSADYVFAPAISGNGAVNVLAGTTVLTGTNSYGGATSVSAGALFVNGDQSAAAGATNVAGGAMLGGIGTIGGNVGVANGGTLAPGGVGGGIGTLTINGSLGLNSGSALNYSFGQAGVVGGPFNDLTVVKGDLTLAGTLNVALTPGGAFDPGLYRVISYAGTLTDNGLLLGSVPPGTTEAVQTSVAYQVSLVNTTGVTLNYWDGAASANKNNRVVDGGNGTWQNAAGNNNWTNVTGALNAAWANAGFAIFEAAPGTVTVDNSLGQVAASGMQFAVSGYTLTGEPITLVETAAGSGATIVRVGDGTAAGTGMTAIIASVLQGSTQVVKDDLGTLVLTGANTYTGGTTISAGTLQLGNGGTSGSILGDVADSGTLAFNRSDIVAFPGLISGSGGLTQAGTGTTILTAANSYSGGTTIAAGTLQLGNGGTSGSILGNVTDNGTLAFDRSDTVSFPGVISGSGGLAQAGTGTTILTAANSYSGATNVNAGGLQAGAPDTFSPNSPVAVASGGSLGLNGFSQTVFGIANAGLVSMGRGTAPGTVLTTASYTGTGGTIAMNTFLGGDGSPSDRLVITGGSATGNSFLRITNAGGLGAETVANGIVVVQATNGATTAPGAFMLSSGELRAGAFDYDLFRGGVSGSPDDWFLRSDFVVPPEPPVVSPGPIPPGPLPPIPPLPTDPPPDPLPPGVYPIIGPELATDGVVQPIARQMGLAMLGTLHERIGDTLTVENAGADAEGWGRSGWARFFGQQIDNRYQAFADPSATGRLLGVQAGFDIWRGSFIPGHRDAAGLYFAYGNTALDVDGLITNAAGTAYMPIRTGTVDLNAYSGGVYWTHYGPGGWYLDAVVQGTAYSGNATTQFANLATDGSGIITSLEAGYPIPLPLGPHFILEPQGQILWQHTSFSQANDGLGPVALGTTSGTTGRLGVRSQWTLVTASGQVWQPYASANLWQNWGGEATTTFGVDQVPLSQESTQLDFAAGVTAKLSTCLSLYAQAGYEFAVGGTDGGRRQGVRGDFGLRLTFGNPPPPPPAPAAVPAAAVARSYLVFFDWDKATLTDRARQIIREAADNSPRVQYTRIEVNGYTDTSGTAHYNQGLSVRRAQTVAAELVRDGVSAAAISIRGFGETNLLVPTGPGVREPQNRRVEIVIR